MPSPLSFRKAPKMSKLRLPLALLVAVVLLNVYFHSMPVHDVTTTPTLAPLEGLPATTPTQITLKPRVVDDTLRDVDPTEAEVDDLALDAGQPLVLPVMENVKLFEGVSSSPIGMTVDGPEELMDRTLLERLCTGSKDDSNNIGDLLPSEKSRQVARYLRMSPKSTGALQTLRDLFESTTERIERKLRFLLVIIAVRSRKRIDVAASVKEWQEHCDSIEDFSLHRSVHARPHLVCLFSVVFPQEYSNKTVQHFTTLFADDDAVHIVQTDVPLSQGILRMQQSGFERSAPYFTRKIGSRTDIDYTFLTSVQMLPIRPQPGVSFFTELLRLYEDASDVVDVMARRIAGGASTRGPLLGCTSVIDEFIPSTTGSLHHYQGNKVVIDQGFDFLFGNGGGGTLLNSLYAVRRHAGLTLHDDRVSGLFRDSTEAVLQSQSSVNASLLPRGVESVHAISPYCALMSERVFRMLSGIPKLGGPAPKVSRSGLRGVDGSTSNSDYAVQSPLEDYEDAVSTGRHMDRNNKTVIQRFVDLLHTPKQAHVRGEDAGEAKQRLVDVLAVRLSQLDRLRSTIRFADVMSGTPPFKRLVSFFIRYLDESVRFFDKSSPTPFTKLPTDLQVLISRLPKEHARIEESHDLAIRMQAKNVDRLSASLVFASRAVEALGRWHKTDQAKTVRQSSNNIIQEEAFMWDLCLRARAHQYPTLISNLTVRIQQHEYLEGAALVAASVDDAHIRISPIYQAYFQRAIMHVSSRITGPFQKEWEPSIIEMGIHPSFHQHPRLQVVWYTHCCHCCGFTNELQSLIYPLQRYVNVHLTAGPDCFCDNASRTLHDTFERLHSHPQNIKRYNSDDVVVYISHTNPTLFHLHREVTHASHDYLVGRSMYEFSRINAEHIEIANRMADEIWVPAQFVYHSYLSSGADREKLVIVPEAIDTHTFNPRTAGKIDMPPANMFYMCNRRVTQATAKESYTFLSDFKWEPRKGWDVLFEAYFRSFTAADSVILFVHTHIWFSGGPETYGWAHNITWMMEDLEHHMRTKTTLYDNKNITVENHPTYCFISQSISVNEMVALYNSVDAFVYTTRGEGWGLPAMQAMSMGLPVIGTNFGGVTEFMKPHNCFLVPLDGVVEIPFDSVYGWSYGTKWAEPSVKEAGRLMRYLASHPDHGARVGAVARQYIVEHFSEEALGKILNDRLQRIREKVLARRSENEMRQQLKP